MALAGHIRRLPLFGRNLHSGAEDDVLQAANHDNVAPPQSTGPLAQVLDIPCHDTLEDHVMNETVAARGTDLANAKDWIGLAAALADADRDRRRVETGEAECDLLALGACGEAVAAVREALRRENAQSARAMWSGSHLLSHLVHDFPREPYLIALVARTHHAIGHVLESAVETSIPARERSQIAELHFSKAADLLERVDPALHQSPFIAATHCAALENREVTPQQILVLHEIWINLDPKSSAALRSLGRQLDPEIHGDAIYLDAAARRMAGMTCDVWGVGGYAWVMFDVITSSTAAAATLDVAYFLKGLDDLLRGANDPRLTNMLAAYCACRVRGAPSGDDQADHARYEVAQFAHTIARSYMRELHPLVWAETLPEFDPITLRQYPDTAMAAGYAEALLVLTDVFRRDLTRGQPVLFGRHLDPDRYMYESQKAVG